MVVPNLYLVTDAAAANLERYVEGGGTLLMSFFSGVVDEHDHIRLGGYPAPFQKLLGLRIEDWRPLAEEETVELEVAGREGRGSVWSELITPHGAEVVGRFISGPAAGRPAVTRHRFGKGTAFYLGTRPAAETMAELTAMACSAAGAASTVAAPAGVEAVRRQGRGRSLLFLLNHGRSEAVVKVGAGSVRLPPGEVRLIREQA